ncbi:MAG: cytochrome c3 family protein [Deltaproteobacteria bacterium]|nr:cytochrome c3 family protein [Deltaproteobacteria bacterium]
MRCHELELDKVRPRTLASGGCTVCHDPHSARYRHLLVADSATFCVRCHEPADIARNEAHRIRRSSAPRVTTPTNRTGVIC